jgi:hypothetical protein
MPQSVRDHFRTEEARRHLIALISSLPRDPDGLPNRQAYEAFINGLEKSIKGAPKAVVDALPTRAWEPPPPHATLAEDALTCGVCLAPYERGEDIRTLPCLHSCAYAIWVHNSAGDDSAFFLSQL